MPIKTKRWNDPIGDDDDFRLLICRYRPRALKKEDETWEAWWSFLGPSRKLSWEVGYCPRFSETRRIN